MVGYVRWGVRGGGGCYGLGVGRVLFCGVEYWGVNEKLTRITQRCGEKMMTEEGLTLETAAMDFSHSVLSP